MPPSPDREVSQLTLQLNNWKAGDPAAAAIAMGIVYEKLKKMAAARLKREPKGSSIQPTDLVHELYLRLEEASEVRFQNRAHFFAIAALTLRRVLYDQARHRNSEKRGGEKILVSLDGLENLPGPSVSLDYLDLERALTMLETFNLRAASIVEMRFFAEMTEDEVAEVLDVNRKTVTRVCKWARVWLRRYLETDQPDKPPSQVDSDEA